jgi:L-asparaginase/Glu-tRNA(Gln) amidotransferase subunit D
MERDGKGVLLTPPKERAVENLLRIEPKLAELAEVEVEYIDNIDSTNIRPRHWDSIAEAIAEHYNAYERVIWGARATKVSESKLNAFQSVNWDLLGEIRIDIRLSDHMFFRHSNRFRPKPGFEPNISVSTFVPGTPAGMLLGLVESGIKGLVLRDYGSGRRCRSPW